MKKFLKMCATFTLLGALVVGCIDNTVDDSIKEMRKAKAALDLAKAAVETARVEYVKADATYRLAEAELRRSEAEINKAIAQKILTEAEYNTIWNKYEKDSLAIELGMQEAWTEYEKEMIQFKIDSLARELELLNAEFDVYVEKQLKLLWDAKTATANAEAAYVNQLKELEKWLLEQEILRDNAVKDELVKVMAEIRVLIGKLDEERGKFYYLQLREYFYKNVDVKQIKAELDGAVEQAGRDKYIAGLVYQTWETVLAASDAQRHELLPVLQNKITVAELEKLNIEKQLVEEAQILAPLTAAWNAAKDAQTKAEAAKTAATVEIKIAALNGGTDNFFSYGTGADQRFSQVYKGQFGFYNKAIPAINNEYPNPTEVPALQKIARTAVNTQLSNTQDYIKRYRLFEGLEGTKQAAEILADRDDVKTKAAKTYNDSLATWKTLYKAGTQVDMTATLRANWLSAKAQYDLALMTYQATYEQGLNPLYKETVKQIDKYVEIVKGIVAGKAEWGAELNQISDVLGGINFDPAKLTELVFQGNFPLIKQVYTALMALPELIVIGEYMNTVMPGFYSVAGAYQGGAYVEPIMQKYQNSSSFDYHAWFLLYMLFEKNQLSIGDGILVINVEGYDNVVKKLSEDFLGFSSENYPGTYKYNSTATTIREEKPTAATRVTDGVAKYPNGKDLNAKNWTVIANLLTAETSLQAAWFRWGAVATKLQGVDGRLFGAYSRNWAYSGYKVDVKTTVSSVDYFKPYWTTDDVTKAIVVEGANKPDFYFRPELAMDDVHPSLELGKAVNFGIAVEGAGEPDGIGQGFNAIYAYRTALINVNWSSWIAMGKPVYNDYPVLWHSTISGGLSSWDNNGDLPAALYAKALITARNHQMFEFWYNNQPAYETLITNIETQKTNNSAEIAKLDATITARKADVAAAKELMDAQQDVIDALEDKKADLNKLIGQYQAIIDAIQLEFENTIEDAYLGARAAFYAAEEAYDLAVANRDMYYSLGVYVNEFGAPTVAVGKFVDNVLEQIAAEKKVVQNQIEEYTIRVAILEAQKVALIEQIGIAL